MQGLQPILTIALVTLTACSGRSPTPQTDDTAAQGTGDCPVTFSYTPQLGEETPEAIYVAGTFNDWDDDGIELEETTLGTWTATTRLPPGSWPYRFVEHYTWTFDDYEAWVCDPQAELIHCEEGYKEAWSTDWAHTCTPGVDSTCNSLLVVADCSRPTLELLALDLDRAAGSLSFELAWTEGSGGAALDRLDVTLDGEPVELALYPEPDLQASISGLAPGRHTLRAQAIDLEGHATEELVVPLWTDVTDPEEGWRQGAIYYAFIDRLVNGDTSNDEAQGATAELGDYMGGDFQGLTALLPYLDELGVRTIWISNPQGNAEGAWPGQCEATFTGYHAYWPDEALAVEERFGGNEALHELVAQAHARDMRVIMDWVANHVHEDHPYYLEHAEEWFNPLELCEDSVGGQLNFDRIPEECWFASYLPDIDYTQPEPLVAMVEDAIWWAKTYDLDGLRVDAAKHMSHAVQWNLQARIRQELEHTALGGDEQFWTVGETFDGYERIAAYMGPEQLDGQFDFPLYYAVNAAFASRSSSLADLEATVATSQATWTAAHEDALMSSFLGNHDVPRFLSYASEGWVSSCQGDDTLVLAESPSDWEPYLRLRQAWAFLYTQPPVPLVYYGDELGLPGYTDPDNRQPLWWHVDDLDTVDSVAAMSAGVSEPRQLVLDAVQRLGQARQEHPAFWRGETVQWWLGPSDYATVWAYARVDGVTGDQVLVILNTSSGEEWLTNGMSFAGLDTEGTWVDVLTDETFVASGDSITVSVAAGDARVLVRQ